MKLNWVRLAALSAAVLFAGGLLAPHAEARQNASATEINRSVSEALAKHGLLRPAGAPATDATVAPGVASDLGPADADQVDKLANGVAQSLKKVQANVSQTLRTDKFRLRLMPRGGSFGGGGRSFGGGGGFGGGGFGGGRPSSGFGGGTGSFGRPSSGFGGGSTTSPRTAPGMSSFGRSGSMGSNNPIRSSSVRPSYASGWGAPTRNYYIGGYPAYGGWWTGYSYGWLHPAWYYYTPFWPSFYYGPPTMYGGVYYPGEFQWGKLILGIIIIGFIIWLLGKLFGGGKGVRYTTYR